MEDYIQVSYLGLPASDIKVMKSMFTLVPELKDSYKFSDFDKSHSANIVVIDADNPSAIITWNEILPRIDNLTGSLMISNSGKTINGSICLKRPLTIKNIVNALETITQDRSIFINPDSGASANAKLSMLIVADSYPVRKYMENKLTEMLKVPLFLSFAASGEEAMLKLAQKNYDIIFLDVVMPGTDGHEVCKAIKKASKSYVVMLTSKKSPFDKIRCTMSGCNAYITKPPSDQRLKQEIQMCVRFRAKQQDNFKKR
jgi:twitching motility two-component system response regulator PilG